ncbi:MAG TPA: EamA family transporter [Candidatus Limnocylindria bacterium]|nr:EamA family transporter [Candidatus Limnocylindria bacterium]
MRRPDGLVLLVFAAIVLIGGTNFVAVRFSNRELAPFWGAALRFALASATLLAAARIAGWRLPRGRALAGALIYGVLGFGVSYALMYKALVVAPAALAAVLIALVPLETLLLASAAGLERLRPRALAGALVAVAGTAVVFGDQLRADVPVAAVVATVAASLAIAGSGVAVKAFPRVHPVPTNAVGMLPGVALLLALSLGAGEAQALPSRPEVVAALVYLVVPGSMGLFIGFLYVLERWTASATSYATVLFPLVTVAVGAAIAGESVSPTFLAGTALVIAGVYLGALSRTAAAPVPAQAPADPPGGGRPAQAR